jgi:hypothetical protein
VASNQGWYSSVTSEQLNLQVASCGLAKSCHRGVKNSSGNSKLEGRVSSLVVYQVIDGLMRSQESRRGSKVAGEADHEWIKPRKHTNGDVLMGFAI